MFWFVGRCSEACRWQLKDYHLLSLTACQRSWEWLSLLWEVQGGLHCRVSVNFTILLLEANGSIDTVWLKMLIRLFDISDVFVLEYTKILNLKVKDHGYRPTTTPLPPPKKTSLHHHVSKATEKRLWGTWKRAQTIDLASKLQVQEMHWNKPHPGRHHHTWPKANFLVPNP